MIAGLIAKSVTVVNHIATAWVNDVCYEIETPMADQVIEDKPYQFYIHHHMHERGQRLYGFDTPDAKQLFIDFISVDNIGPSKAIKVMSSMEPEKIMMYLADGSAELLAEAQGIGRKSADKLVLDLQKKYAPKYSTTRDMGTLNAIQIRNMSHPSQISQEVKDKINETVNTAVLALIKLGYTKKDAKVVLEKADLRAIINPTQNLEDNVWDFNAVLAQLIKYGLKILNSGDF